MPQFKLTSEAQKIRQLQKFEGPSFRHQEPRNVSKHYVTCGQRQEDWRLDPDASPPQCSYFPLSFANQRFHLEKLTWWVDKSPQKEQKAITMTLVLESMYSYSS